MASDGSTASYSEAPEISMSAHQNRLLWWREREAELKADLEKQPGNPRTLMDLGRLYSRMHRTLPARACFEKVQSVNSGYQHVKLELAFLNMLRGLRSDVRAEVSDILWEMPIGCTLEAKDIMTRIMVRYLSRAQKIFQPGSADYREIYGDVVGNIAVHKLQYSVSVILAEQLCRYVTPDCSLQTHLSMQNIPAVLFLKRRSETVLDEYSTENPFWDGYHTIPVNEMAEALITDPEREFPYGEEEAN